MWRVARGHRPVCGSEGSQLPTQRCFPGNLSHGPWGATMTGLEGGFPPGWGAQLVGASSLHTEVVGPIPGQGTRKNQAMNARKVEQPTDVSSL